jgi:hypothetical protein
MNYKPVEWPDVGDGVIGLIESPHTRYLDALVRDAARYRWLREAINRSNTTPGASLVEINGFFESPCDGTDDDERLDAAIDSAM